MTNNEARMTKPGPHREFGIRNSEFGMKSGGRGTRAAHAPRRSAGLLPCCLAASLPRRLAALHPRRSRGILLLEVILAIAILTLGMAAIGGQIFQARKASEYADRLARAVMLAESVITALDARLLEPEQEIQGDFVTDEGEEGSIGYFGVQYLPWVWHVLIDPTREEGMFLVTVEIYHHSDPAFDPAAIDLTTFRRGDGPAKLGCAPLIDTGFFYQRVKNAKVFSPI